MELRGIPDYEFYARTRPCTNGSTQGSIAPVFPRPDADGEAEVAIVHELSGGTGKRAGRLVQEMALFRDGPDCSFSSTWTPASRAAQDRAGLRLAPGLGRALVPQGPTNVLRPQGAGGGRNLPGEVDALQVPYVLPQETAIAGVRSLEMAPAPAELGQLGYRRMRARRSISVPPTAA